MARDDLGRFVPGNSANRGGRPDAPEFTLIRGQLARPSSSTRPSWIWPSAATNGYCRMSMTSPPC